MINQDVHDHAAKKFADAFHRPHTVAAYAPGRIEVLGNHTDYNEGFVLSAGIDLGTFFLVAPSDDAACRLLAGDTMEEATFDVASPTPVKGQAWSNYVKGVFAKLRDRGSVKTGFTGMLLGNLPLGAGLSSSAALEMSAGMAFCELYGIKIEELDLAKIGQAAEHEYAGIRCGLLDQISAMFARDNELVMSDFRSLKIEHVPMTGDAKFIVCNTKVKHSLVDSEYNERRATCEKTARFFASVLKHPVSALRDVSWSEWQQYSSKMDPVMAKRSAHVIGENTRVLEGRDLLMSGKLADFGKLMFESHESSRVNYENSCKELDFLVAAAKKTSGALGARLSGGGFGGSTVVLVRLGDVKSVGDALTSAYAREFGHQCDTRVVSPSAGAKICRSQKSIA
jgi:galactokinase